MSTPEVRVRLTPEGVREVADALRRTQRDADRVQKRSAAGIRNLTSEFGRLRGVLGSLGLGVSIAGIGALVRSAINAADQMQKFSQRFGASAENISVLAFAADTADVSVDRLGRGLRRASDTLLKAQVDTSRQAAALRALNLSLEEFAGLDSAQAFTLIADRLSLLPDGTRKVQIAMAILGDEATDLIPLINDLGTQGFERLAVQAENAGKVISTEMANSAAEVNDSFTRMQQSLQGLVNDFARGFLPGVQSVLFQFERDLDDAGARPMRIFGEFVGNTMRAIMASFVVGGNVIGFVLTEIVERLSAAGRAAVQAANGEWGEAWRIIREDAARSLDFSALVERTKRQLDEVLIGPPRRTPPPPRDRGGFVPDGNFGVFRDPGATSAAATKATAEAKRQQAARDAILDIEERILSLRGEDRAAAERALDREIAGFREKLQAAGKLNDVTQARLATLREAALAELDADARRAVLDLEQQILTAKGETREAALAALDEELEKTRQVLRAAGELTDQTEQRIAALRQVSVARIDFEAVRTRAERVLAEIADARTRIEQDVALGIQTQIGGSARILELERERLPLLQEIAAAARAAAQATGDPALVAQAQQIADRIRQVAQSVALGGDALIQFRDRLRSGIQGDLSNFFSEGIRGAKDFEDAMRSLGDSIINTLSRIAAEIIAQDLTTRLFSLAGGVGGSTGTGGGGFFPGFRGLAAGGAVHGPGSGTSDSVGPVWLSRGEYVTRERAVSQPGGLALMESINRGQVQAREIWAALRRSPGRAFAAGGLVHAQPIRMAEGGLAMFETRSSAGGMAVNQTFVFQQSRPGEVSRQTAQQVAAEAARGLQQASRRNN